MKSPSELKSVCFVRPEAIAIEKAFDEAFDKRIVYEGDDTILWRQAPATLATQPSYNGFNSVKFSELEKEVISTLLRMYDWGYEFVVETRMVNEIIGGPYELIESKIKIKPRQQ